MCQTKWTADRLWMCDVCVLVSFNVKWNQNQVGSGVARKRAIVMVCVYGLVLFSICFLNCINAEYTAKVFPFSVWLLQFLFAAIYRLSIVNLRDRCLSLSITVELSKLKVCPVSSACDAKPVDESYLLFLMLSLCWPKRLRNWWKDLCWNNTIEVLESRPNPENPWVSQIPPDLYFKPQAIRVMVLIWVSTNLLIILESCQRSVKI